MLPREPSGFPGKRSRVLGKFLLSDRFLLSPRRDLKAASPFGMEGNRGY